MGGALACLDLGDEVLQRRHPGKRAVGDRLLDARQILQHDATGAEIGVADLGIAHLAVGQPDIMLARVEMRMRPAPHQPMPYRRLRPFDGIVVAVRALPPAVEDTQHKRARTGSHGSRCLNVKPAADVYANEAPLR